ADVDRLAAVQAEGARVLAVLELQRQHAHADQVGAVDALEALGYDRLDPEQQGALGRPVARGTGAVLLPREHHQRRALGLVLYGGVVDGRLAAGVAAAAVERGVAAFLAAQYQVLDADVGEGAAAHHVVVPAVRAVAVEVGRLHAARLQEAARRRILQD